KAAVRPPGLPADSNGVSPQSTVPTDRPPARARDARRPAFLSGCAILPAPPDAHPTRLPSTAGIAASLLLRPVPITLYYPHRTSRLHRGPAPLHSQSSPEPTSPHPTRATGSTPAPLPLAAP